MIRVFGITGTNGKTTASWMLRNILQQNEKCAIIGTVVHEIGDSRYEPKNTTPGKEQLEAFFREMKQKKIGACVMEVSSHGIHQGRTDDIIFTGTGFTNLSRDHLDYHEDMEQYYQVKKKLFTDSDAAAAVNLDDEYGRRLYMELDDKVSSGNCAGYSLYHQEADYYGRITSEDLSGTEIDIYEKGAYVIHLEVLIPGRQFASDALLAYSMARQAGCTAANAAMGLKKVSSVTGRMEMVGSPEDTLGIVDYAHTPDSLQHLMRTVADIKKAKVICVFGCGGFRDKGKRRIMGEIAGRCSDYCIITNDNPRGEAPENIAQSIEEGVYSTGCEYCVILDRYQAIKRAVSLADKWDIIVVAGKGHENYQLSGTEIVPFNDKEVLKELLEKKYEKTYNGTDQ